MAIAVGCVLIVILFVRDLFRDPQTFAAAVVLLLGWLIYSHFWIVLWGAIGIGVVVAFANWMTQPPPRAAWTYDQKVSDRLSALKQRRSAAKPDPKSMR